jgi:hypothetical protein
MKTRYPEITTTLLKDLLCELLEALEWRRHPLGATRGRAVLRSRRVFQGVANDPSNTSA